MAVLVANTHVPGHGWWGPAYGRTEPPPEVAALITNPACWDSPQASLDLGRYERGESLTMTTENYVEGGEGWLLSSDGTTTIFGGASGDAVEPSPRSPSRWTWTPSTSRTCSSSPVSGV